MYRHRLLAVGAAPFSRLHHSAVHVRTAGLVVARQKPPTAEGFAFWLLEDNTERMQVVVSPEVWEKSRQILRDAPLLLTERSLSRERQAWTLRAEEVWGI